MNESAREEYLTNGSRNPFYEGNLNGRDKEFIKGYDACVEKQIEGFFADIADYAEDLRPVGIDTGVLDVSAVCADSLTDEEIDKLGEETRLIGTLHDCILDYMERRRNGIIQKMIEAYNK